ncbi:MAG: KOW domain-containing RNA-binding protein [Oscillospiraceae bacterium]|nr:KOW domain-containing RNA-binding protein [Oscillospiraceae bacterium]
MEFEKAQIVRSRSGHDSGELFLILDVDGDRLLLADGKRRRVSRPKRKNAKHVESAGGWEHPTFEKVRAGQSIGDRELRAALAEIRDKMEV